MSKNRILALAGALALFVWLLPGGDSKDGDYRVDAIFDTAKGMVPGQVVKVAGTRVGKVDDIRLTDDRKARMELSVKRDVAPFRADATCRILPEGFISESYVDCDPGTSEDRLGEDRSTRTPTVVLSKTAVPVALQDVVDVFGAPVGDRIGVLLSELGIGAAGRAKDINDVIRRANPALKEARQFLAVVDGQRTVLADAISQTNDVVAALGPQSASIKRFIDRAGALSKTVADRRTPLGTSLQQMPRTLDSARSGLGTLDTAMARLTPLIGDLDRASPTLQDFSGDAANFLNAGTPALRALRSTARQGRKTVPVALPTLKHLTAFGNTSADPAKRLRSLLADLRDTGTIESTEKLLYGLAATTSLRDENSHFAALYIGVYLKCFVDRNSEGCRHAFNAPGQGQIPTNDPSVTKNDPFRPGTVGSAARSRKASPDKKVDSKVLRERLDRILGR